MGTNTTVDGLRTLPTRHTVAEVLQRVQSLARARGLTVFAQIDFSGDAERSGLALRPTGLVILGNPKSGTPLIVATPTVAIDLPLKILAWQNAEGQTWVAYNEPEYVQTRHRFPPELSKNIAALGGRRRNGGLGRPHGTTPAASGSFVPGTLAAWTSMGF